jgi:hypothetical protein
MSGSARRAVAGLCQQSAAMLEALGLPAMFTLTRLRERVEQRRGRPVHLIARHLPALVPHGLWVAGEHADYVFYALAAGPLRQHQIIGHELGHLLFDDGCAHAGPAEVAAMLAPDVRLGLAGSLRLRTTYQIPAERRAETFGTVALARMAPWDPLPAPDPVDRAMLARLVATFEGGGCRR